MFIIFCLHDSPIECPGAKPLALLVHGVCLDPHIASDAIITVLHSTERLNTLLDLLFLQNAAGSTIQP
jgi:hypothetical protein